MTDTIKISIRLTKDELAEIDRRAESQNLSRNEYIKICAFSEDALNKTKALAFAQRLIQLNYELDKINDEVLKETVRKEGKVLWQKLKYQIQ